jgi:hypothetical protein
VNGFDRDGERDQQSEQSERTSGEPGSELGLYEVIVHQKLHASQHE